VPSATHVTASGQLRTESSQKALCFRSIRQEDALLFAEPLGKPGSEVERQLGMFGLVARDLGKTRADVGGACRA
jgi:hypothetical protein